MSINPLNEISRVYLEQVAAVEEGVRPGNVEKPLDKAAFKKRRRSLAGKEKSAEARKRGHVGKEWYNSGRTYSPDEAKFGRAKLDDAERRTRHRSAVDPDSENDDLYSADKTKNPKKLRKQKAMGESAVPGKPAERLGAVTAIPKAERDAARERLLAKAKAKREKMKEEIEIDEAVKGADTEMRREASKERRTKSGKRLSPSEGKGYATQQKQSIAFHDKRSKGKHIPGFTYSEALDAVGKEDADVDNDGKKGTNADKYLMKRRKAIGKAISTQEAKEVKRWWDDDGDGKGYEEGEVSGKFKKKKVKESFSNWRQDLVEVIDVIEKKEKDEKISEKTVKNKIKINPNMGEAIENLGGTLLEMVEIDEMDYILESVYDELLEEGYEEDDIEEALEYSLTEAKVTFGHDTAAEKKRSGLMTAAKARLSSLKKSAKQAVATGARKVAKGALKVARKVEGGDKTPSAAHTGTRKASTYRGAGAGQKERVSSGSYTPPTKKKAEKPSDPWEGSATTPPKAKAKPKAATKKAAAPKAKAPVATKKKRKSKLDDLLASVRSEEIRVSEQSFDINASGHRQQQRIEKATKLQQATKGAESTAAGSAVKRLGGSGVSLPLANSYKPEGTQLQEKPGDGYLGPTPIPNPIRLTKDVVDATNRTSQKKVDAVNSVLPGSASMPKHTYFNKGPSAASQKYLGLKNSYELNGSQLDEKTLSKKETKEKERIVKSMKDKASDFEKRYPGRGKEVMYATATKLAKKIAK